MGSSVRNLTIWTLFTLKKVNKFYVWLPDIKNRSCPRCILVHLWRVAVATKLAKCLLRDCQSKIFLQMARDGFRLFIIFGTKIFFPLINCVCCIHRLTYTFQKPLVSVQLRAQYEYYWADQTFEYNCAHSTFDIFSPLCTWYTKHFW